MVRNFITFEIPGSQLIQPRRRELPRKERGIPDRGSGMSEPRNEVAGLAPRLMNRSQNENDQGTRARNSGSLESVRTPWPTRRDRLSRLCRAFLFQRKKEMLGLLRSQARSVVSICARSRVEKRERVIVLPTVKLAAALRRSFEKRRHLRPLERFRTIELVLSIFSITYLHYRFENLIFFFLFYIEYFFLLLIII